MTIEDDIAFLEQVPTLRPLGADALRILAIGAESYAVEGGQMLFASGEPADCAYIVQRGSFKLDAGDEEITAGPGTLLGESALLAETPAARNRDGARGFHRAAHFARHVHQDAGKLSGRTRARRSARAQPSDAISAAQPDSEVKIKRLREPGGERGAPNGTAWGVGGNGECRRPAASTGPTQHTFLRNLPKKAA